MKNHTKKLSGVESFGAKQPEIRVSWERQLLSLTGRVYNGHNQIETRTEEYRRFEAEHIPRKKPKILPRTPDRQLSRADRKILTRLLERCGSAPDRSIADFHLCCVAIGMGLDKEEAWRLVRGEGKFAERGRDYFDLTWENALQAVDVGIENAVPGRDGKLQGLALATIIERLLALRGAAGRVAGDNIQRITREEESRHAGKYRGCRISIESNGSGLFRPNRKIAFAGIVFTRRSSQNSSTTSPTRLSNRKQPGESFILTLVFGTVLPWLLIAVGTWLGYQLVRQNGRILLRLESIEAQLGTRTQAPRREAGGLPAGSMAPDFDLPDLAGVRHKLSEFRDKNMLLIFFNPQCGFCTKMAADLAALPAEGDDKHAIPVVVTTGDAEENRKLVSQYGIRCVVLLQKQMEVASQYRAQGTPMGYRIDSAGRIASELTVGAEPLLKLAAANAPHAKDTRVAANGSGPHGGKDPSLARSRLNRDGLKAGTPAPEFRLPRIDGDELSLADFRGERVLLVFSDPDCGPCDELALRLQELHLQRRDLHVLVVSRRDVEASRAKAAKLGLSFPIVMQRQWEISLKYAMFATPIGYLIDEQGLIVREVAIGVEPILALANGPADTSSDIAGISHSGKEPAWVN